MKSEIWNEFCQDQGINDSAIPLFEINGNVAQTKEIGRKNKRRVLVRSKQMENAVLTETDKLVEDYQSGANYFDGLIYIMYKSAGTIMVPLYIGKAETHWKN